MEATISGCNGVFFALKGGWPFPFPIVLVSMCYWSMRRTISPNTRAYTVHGNDKK